MKTREPPPESRAKGAGKDARKHATTESLDEPDDSPMGKFKELARGVVKVPREAVIKEEKAEKRRKRD